MKYSITENKMYKVIFKSLDLIFPGFNNIYYDWAEFNCGMGVCCDPFAVGFVLPDNEYNDYLFLLVDSENYKHDGDYPEELKGDLPEPCYDRPNLKNPDFDLIIFYEVFAEDIKSYFGNEKILEKILLNILNEKFDMKATSIMFI